MSKMCPAITPCALFKFIYNTKVSTKTNSHDSLRRKQLSKSVSQFFLMVDLNVDRLIT